ncbi:MAG: dCTP deaminase [Halobacteriales archaeon]|nr:dCTP deaminase [Halobacteriales archaeon]
MEIDDTVHEETQRTDAGFDLTVAEIYAVEEAGRVDFGGGELEEAELTPVETEKRNEDDDYGWWNLESGTYVFEHNETLNADEAVTVRTRTALLERGAFHPTVRVAELPRLPLVVGGDGLRVKANARVSTVVEG